MKNSKEEQLKRIDLRIVKIRGEVLDHIENNRPTSARLLAKTIDSLNIKKYQLEQ